MESHPYADIFPIHDGDNIAGLRADLKRVGQQEPIWTFEDMILDGRRRELACKLEGIEPWYKPYKGNDPLAFVISKNLHRRHLSDDERAFVAAKIANIPGAGRPSGKTDISAAAPISQATKTGILRTAAISQTQAAELLNVSTDAVKRAAKVEKNGTPAQQKAVQEGAVSLTDAARVAGEPAKVQNAAVKAVTTGKAATASEAAKPAAPVIFCRPCRVGTPVKGCKACADLRKLRAGTDKELEKEEEPVEETIEDVIKRKNGEIESFARRLSSLMDEMPSDEWLSYNNHDGGIRQKIKDACSALRAAKCHAACPGCKGAGCRSCQKTGRVTKYQYDQLV